MDDRTLDVPASARSSRPASSVSPASQPNGASPSCVANLIANSLVARVWTVVHLLHGSAPKPHVLGQRGAMPSTGPDGIVTYPAGAS